MAPKPERTYKGRVYASKAEAEVAALIDLDCGRGGSCIHCFRQVPVDLGEDFRTVVDFMLTIRGGGVDFVEVKGYETREFKRVLALWDKYVPYPLWVVRRKGRSKFEWEMARTGRAGLAAVTTDRTFCAPV